MKDKDKILKMYILVSDFFEKDIYIYPFVFVSAGREK